MPANGNGAQRERDAIPRQSAARWEQAVCSVYAVAGYEPLLHGLVAAVSESPQLQVVGKATTIDALTDDPAVTRADVLVIDAGVLVDGRSPNVLPYNLPIKSIVLLKDSRDEGWGALDAVTALTRLTGLAIVDKDGSGERLREAIRLVQRGAFICEMATIRTAVRQLAAMFKFTNDTPIEALSHREAEVLDLVAVGLSNREIGWRLSVSEGTVKAHVSHIMAKLRLGNRSQLVAYALATGTTMGLGRNRKPQGEGPGNSRRSARPLPARTTKDAR